MATKVNPNVEKMTSFIVMDVLERAKELQEKGVDVIHLEVGEPDFEPSDEVVVAGIKAFAEGETHYTHSLGDIELRREIAKFYKCEYGVSVDEDTIVVTSGSSPAILMALQLLCEPGSEVIMTNPGYACYKNFTLAANAVPVPITVKAEDGFQYPIEALKAAITPKTRAIFVNSPMNPAGTLVSKETYAEIAKLGIPIISDEIYHGLVYNGTPVSVLEVTDNAFVLNGFSKRYAMTGLRLGYMIAPKKYMKYIQTMQQNLAICAPSMSQKAGIAALRYGEEDVKKRLEIYNERRVYMIDRLRKMGFVIETEPQGAFYIFANAKKFTNDCYKFAFDVLENAHVGITPGVDFGTNGEGYVRLSYANSLDNIKEALDRIEKYLKKC